MYEVYELKKKDIAMCHTTSPYTELLIEKPSVDVFGNSLKGRVISLFWRIITFGKGKVYTIRDDRGVVIHYSCVFPRCYKFPFLKKRDFEVGPCFTAREYRGKGLYPYVLMQIAKQELLEDNGLYLMINTENEASIRGVKKAGFKPLALMKRDVFGRHVVAKCYDSMEDIQNEFFEL